MRVAYLVRACTCRVPSRLRSRMPLMCARAREYTLHWLLLLVLLLLLLLCYCCCCCLCYYCCCCYCASTTAADVFCYSCCWCCATTATAVVVLLLLLMLCYSCCCLCYYCCCCCCCFLYSLPMLLPNLNEAGLCSESSSDCTLVTLMNVRFCVCFFLSLHAALFYSEATFYFTFTPPTRQG